MLRFLGQIPNSGAGPMPNRRVSKHAGFAIRGGQAPGQDPERGGLASIRRSDHAENLSTADFKADIVQGADT